MQSKQLIKIPNDLQLAWFAGLVDGEGCIFIGGYTKNGKPNPYYFVNLTICMTHLTTLEVVCTMWGLGRVVPHSKSKKDIRKQRWDWCVSGPRCSQILTLCYPYLITKKADALIAITMQHRLSATKPNREYRVPDIEHIRRKLLTDLCKAVKRDYQLSQHIENEINEILENSPKYQLRLNSPSAQVVK
jgi:hypothetical protein